MDWLGRAIDWIEGHQHTVDLLKWAVLLLVAWVTGLLKLIKATVQRITRKPRLIIDAETSRCYVERYDRYEQKDAEGKPVAAYLNAVKVIYFLDVSVLNPTLDKVTVRHFSLSYRTHRWEDAFKLWWRRKKPEGWRKNFSQNLAPVSIPTHPRTEVGAGVKLLRVFMTKYADTSEFMVPASQVVESKEMESGYLMFISFTYGHSFYNPLNYKGQIDLVLKARLLDGVIKSQGLIPIVETFESLERIVPGIKEYAEDARTWNAEMKSI